MRTPRWLTVATIALSVVFIIWLCLVIPNNAPKQRVRIEKVKSSCSWTVGKSKALVPYDKLVR